MPTSAPSFMMHEKRRLGDVVNQEVNEFVENSAQEGSCVCEITIG